MDEKKLYELLSKNLSSYKVSVKKIKKPDSTIEKEVTKIYTQAHGHRDRLVTFYIAYTIIFTLLILGLIYWQGYIRAKYNSSFEIVPQWGLDLLVTGMFVQFIGLLKVVTEHVWDYKTLFSHHTHHMKAQNSSDSTPGNGTVGMPIEE